MDLWILSLLLVSAVVTGSTSFCNENATSLKLFSQNLGVFPDLSACAARLTHLDLSNNQISSIPAEIGTFIKLEELILNNNLLKEFPTEIGDLPSLQVLWVNNNILSGLPSSIGRVSNLRELRIDDNEISVIPTEVGHLSNLMQLYAGGNQLNHLPLSLSQLSKLILLSMPHNNLTEIPAEFGMLTNLITFAGYDNSFRCLPRSLWSLPRLSTGDLYVPACSNHTAEGYLTGQTAQRKTCEGTASKINGTALGCFDYVHTTCAMTATEVTVTTRRLSDLSSLGLRCAADAPQVGQTEVVTYPRCDPHTGVATACAGTDALNTLHRGGGLVILHFGDRDSCDIYHRSAGTARRLSTTTATLRPAIHTRARRTVPPTDRKPRATELSARHASAGGFEPPCDATTTDLVVRNASADLSACRESLSRLTVHGVDFSLLAPQISKLMNLQSLRVVRSWNVQVPVEFEQMRRLTALEIEHCPLSEWPEILPRMPVLTHLSLTATLIYSLPPWLEQLHSLVYLNLSDNDITEIGDKISELKNLETLIVTESHVTTVSAAIGRLTHMHTLDLRGNPLLRLPASLASLTRLQVLSIQDSNFECVPDAVRAMPLLADAHYFDNTPSCEAALWAEAQRLLCYSLMRSDACLRSEETGLWYKIACGELYVTLYADDACTQLVERRALHSDLGTPPLRQCTDQRGAENKVVTSYTYCHS